MFATETDTETDVITPHEIPYIDVNDYRFKLLSKN